MCGIVGYATTKNKWALEKFFKQALVADVLRGLDSTGVVIGNDQGYKFTKKAVNALDFLDMKSVDKMVNSLPVNRPTFMIGHNRSATVGSVSSDNAHPFAHGDIVGVHNGTLRNYWKLERPKDFGTDSEALYFNLSRNPVDTVLNEVSGAYALVWWDNAKQTINIIRNDERPLALAKLEGEETLVWASEAGMLRWIAARNGLKVENIIEPKPNVLITIHLDSDELSTFEYNQLDIADPYPVYGYGGNYGGKGGSTGRSGTSGNSSSSGGTKALPNKADQYTKNEALDVLGLDLRHTVYPVYIDEFESYTGTTEFGCITAYLMVEPWIEVKIKAVPVKDFDENKHQEMHVCLSGLNVSNGRLWESYADGYLVDPEESDETYIGPEGTSVSLSDMQELTKEGCILCRNPINRSEFDFTDFVDGKPVCPDCIATDRGGFEA